MHDVQKAKSEKEKEIEEEKYIIYVVHSILMDAMGATVLTANILKNLNYTL